MRIIVASSTAIVKQVGNSKRWKNLFLKQDANCSKF